MIVVVVSDVVDVAAAPVVAFALASISAAVAVSLAVSLVFDALSFDCFIMPDIFSLLLRLLLLSTCILLHFPCVVYIRYCFFFLLIAFACYFICHFFGLIFTLSTKHFFFFVDSVQFFLALSFFFFFIVFLLLLSMLHFVISETVENES